MSELKPCPFCGSNELHYDEEYGAAVSCTDCAALAESAYAWNRRAAPQDDALGPVTDEELGEPDPLPQDDELARLERVAAKLRKAGATLPAPEPTGTIEGSMLTGLSIALAVVEEEIDNRAGVKD